MNSTDSSSNTASSAGFAQSKLYNADLAPVSAAQRTWSMWSIAALWVGMAICITILHRGVPPERPDDARPAAGTVDMSASGET